MEGAKAFLEREYNGFLDEFDEQELHDIVVAMEDYTSQQVKILPIADVVWRSEQLPCDCKCPLAETDLQHYCPKCWKTWKIK